VGARRIGGEPPCTDKNAESQNEANPRLRLRSFCGSPKGGTPNLAWRRREFVRSSAFRRPVKGRKPHRRGEAQRNRPSAALSNLSAPLRLFRHARAQCSRSKCPPHDQMAFRELKQ
jgi:hypothetical protein